MNIVNKVPMHLEKAAVRRVIAANPERFEAKFMKEK